MLSLLVYRVPVLLNSHHELIFLVLFDSVMLKIMTLCNLAKEEERRGLQGKLVAKKWVVVEFELPLFLSFAKIGTA
jgi:hypothetical protein